MDLTGLKEKKNRRGTVYYENGAGEIVAKKCSRCAEEKALVEFYKDSRRVDGRQSHCKCCRDAANVEWHDRNPDYNAAAISSKWYRENRERHADSCRNWCRNNLGKVNSKARKWKRDNPDKTRLHRQRYLARKRLLPDTLTAEQYAETLAYFENACALTGETTDLHREHAIPLSVGHGGTIRENMYPMAGRLNISKGNRNIFEWFEANRQRFKLSQTRFDRLIEWLAASNAMTVEEYRDYVYWCHANPREIKTEISA